VSGTATFGQTLTTTNGTWTGSPTIVYTYQWQRDGVDIGGATASTYVQVAADAGKTIRCRVTGTNGVGNATANSNGKLNLSFMYDTFTDTDNVSLTSHTGEVGATWVRNALLDATATAKVANNRIITNNGVNGLWYASGVPASADYHVYMDFYAVRNSSSFGAGYLGPTARLATGAATCYYGAYSAGAWGIGKIVAGSFTGLGTPTTMALVAATTYRMDLSVIGTTITLKVDGVTMATATDSAISAVGLAGILGLPIAADMQAAAVDAVNV
jgi:hypothetical protein